MRLDASRRLMQKPPESGTVHPRRRSCTDEALHGGPIEQRRWVFQPPGNDPPCRRPLVAYRRYCHSSVPPLAHAKNAARHCASENGPSRGRAEAMRQKSMTMRPML
jgi:hypothetical protein